MFLQVEEEESGPASPVFNKAHKPPARGQRHQKKPRMIVTKHPVVRSTKSKKAKSRKSLELDSDEGVELEFGDVDKTPSRKEYWRSTRRFSPLGFLMVLCTSGLDTVTTATSRRRRKSQNHQVPRVTT